MRAARGQLREGFQGACQLPGLGNLLPPRAGGCYRSESTEQPRLPSEEHFPGSMSCDVPW